MALTAVLVTPPLNDSDWRGELLKVARTRDTILPMTVLRLLDAVHEPTKQALIDMKVSLGKARAGRYGKRSGARPSAVTRKEP